MLHLLAARVCVFVQEWLHLVFSVVSRFLWFLWSEGEEEIEDKSWHQLIPGLPDCVVEQHVFPLLPRKSRHSVCSVSKGWLSSLKNLSSVPNKCFLSYSTDEFGKMEVVGVSAGDEVEIRFDTKSYAVGSFYLSPDWKLWLWNGHEQQMRVMDLSAWKWEWEMVGVMGLLYLIGVVSFRGETYAFGYGGEVYMLKKSNDEYEWIFHGKAIGMENLRRPVTQVSVDTVNSRIVGLRPADKAGFWFFLELDLDRVVWSQVSYLDCSRGNMLGYVHLVSPQGKLVSRFFGFEQMLHPTTRFDSVTTLGWVVLLQDKQKHVYVDVQPANFLLYVNDLKRRGREVPKEASMCSEQGVWEGQVDWEKGEISWKKIVSGSHTWCNSNYLDRVNPFPF